MAYCFFVIFVKKIAEIIELLIEALSSEEPSQYEIERNKHIPSLNHGYLQTKLPIVIGSRYLKDYTLISELSLEMLMKPNTVPDIAIYPKMKIDFLHDVTTMTTMPTSVIEIVSSSPI